MGAGFYVNATKQPWAETASHERIHGRRAFARSHPEYLAAGHAVLQFGPDNVPAFDEWFMRRFGVSRRVEVTSASMVGVGEPEEIAGVAVMLASRAGGFITGHHLVVDGGTTIGDGN